jgi:hypothetical protein
MSERAFFEDFRVRRRPACAILSHRRSSMPKREPSSVPLTLMASNQAPSTAPLYE